MRRTAAILVLAVTAFALQRSDIPVYPGDPDTGAHKGQPLFCQNYPTREHVGNCDCYASRENGRCKQQDGNGDGPDSYDESAMPQCKVHCRKDACQCQRKCET
jgi:hypothetical protein